MEGKSLKELYKDKERILICGSSRWDHADDKQIASLIKSLPKDSVFIYSDSPGVARIVDKHAKEQNLLVWKFSSNYKNDKKKAHKKRNERLISEGKPNLVIGIKSKRGKYMITGEEWILNYALEQERKIRVMWIDL